MPYTAHDPRVFYDAVISRLETSTGKNIGQGEAPPNLTLPYAVVRSQDETDVDVNLADPHDLTIFEWFVMSVGSTEDQALWMQQKVRVALLGWQPSVAGITCGFVMRDGGAGVTREDAAQPPTFFAVDRFNVLAD